MTDREPPLSAELHAKALGALEKAKKAIDNLFKECKALTRKFERGDEVSLQLMLDCTYSCARSRPASASYIVLTFKTCFSKLHSPDRSLRHARTLDESLYISLI